MSDDCTIGFRGYITSRPIDGVPYPHKIQNLVIRDYCRRKELPFYLSATEVSVPDSFMMLNGLLAQIDDVAGIVIFSQHMLPAAQSARCAIYDRVLSRGRQLHAALEESAIQRASDIENFDSALMVAAWLPATPFKGRFPASLDEQLGFPPALFAERISLK